VSSFLENKAIAFLKLVRVENLLMIALTQVFIRSFIMEKSFALHHVPHGMNDGVFYLLVLSTVLIAAGGYIINDYFDVKTDLINHPDTVVVDRVIKRRWAIILHITFTLTGIFLGMFAAFKTGYLRLAIFHFGAAILLWFYSTDFKKMLLVGNFTVSVLTAAVPFMPFVYEMGLMQNAHPGFIFSYRYAVLASFKVVGIYSLFAFITSLAREIIKDMEDYRGDKATGGRTMPVVWGIRSSQIAAFFLLVITSLLLLFVVYNSVRLTHRIFSVDNFYVLLGLVTPLTVLAFYVLSARNSMQFKNASLFLKFIMLVGLGFSMIYYYN